MNITGAPSKKFEAYFKFRWFMKLPIVMKAFGSIFCDIINQLKVLLFLHRKTCTAQIIYLVYFLLSTNTLFSQNTTIDSLKLELQNQKEKDTIRVNLLNELASLYHNQDFDTTMAYIEESSNIADVIDFKKGKARSSYLNGITQAFHSNFKQGLDHYYDAIDSYRTINFNKGIAECYNSIGRFFYKNGNQKNAIENYKKSLNIYEELNDTEEIFALLNNIGWSYIQIGDYNQAITFYKKALDGSKEVNNQTLLSYCLSDLGVIYTHQSNYPLALEYFNKSLIVGKKNKDSISIGNTLGNMGPVYNHLENYDKAIECYKESIEYLRNTNKNATASNLNNIGLVYKDIMDYELANEYLKDAQTKFKEINNRAGEASSLNNIGDVYTELKEYIVAHQYYERARKINLEVDNQLGLCHSFLGIATVYVNQENYNKALSYALRSEQISNKLELIDYQRNVSKLLVEIYESTSQYKKALSSHVRFKRLNDSLFNKANVEKIAQLEYEYRYKQALDSASIRELQLTKTVTATSLDLEKSQRNYLWAIIGVLLVSIFLGAIIFYQKFSNIKTRNENIVMEQKLLRSQMTPHFIFNSLSVLQGMILNREDKKSVSYLSKFSKLLRITLENSRDKTVLLSEEITAVQNYLALQNLENKAYQYTVKVDDTIDTTSLKIPPMLIQPFIENAVEHAFTNQKENRKIDVHVQQVDAQLICTVTDNGIGIDSQEAGDRKHKKSLATIITSERLEILAKDLKMQGSVTVEDRKKYKEKGTVVTLVIPYKTVT